MRPSRVRSYLWIAVILVVVVVIGVITAHATKKESADAKAQETTQIAVNQLEPITGCTAKSSSTTPADATAGTKYSVTSIMTCSARTASTLDAQLKAQVKARNYPTLPSNTPEWGCFENSSNTSACIDSFDASSGQIDAHYVINIPDQAAEADQNLGTEDYLGTKTVTDYQLTLSYSGS